MGWGSVIFLVALLTCFSFGFYLFYNEMYNVDSQAQIFVADNPEVLQGLSQQSKQFYPAMRFPDKRISYGFADDCDDLKKANVRESFSILDEASIIEFYEGSRNGGIEVYCSQMAPKSEDKGHFVAGEGGPTKILNASVFYIIQQAQIELYRDEKCETPHVAIHEILHALGFDHNNNEKSILYPITSCEQEIDSQIINTINNLYSVKSLPDIAISKVDVNKTGRYLNFEITLSNYGLKDYENSILTISDNSEKIGEYNIDKIEIGHAKIFTVTNQKISNSAQSVIFEIKSDVSKDELNIDNNRVGIALQSQ